MHTMNITSARKEFLELSDTVQDEPLFITKRGRPVMAMISIDQYEGMLETIEILRDQVFARRLQKSLEQIREGKTRSFEEAKAMLLG